MDALEQLKGEPAVSRESLKSTEKESDERDGAKIAAGLAATESARRSTQEAAIKFAKPETYTGNRQMFDSGAAKRNAKMNTFGSGMEVIDPYTGDRLVLTKKEAKLLYGDDWTKHLAESDHIKPLEKVFEETKDKPWLSTDDVKDIGNSKENIQVVSRKTNNAKRSKTNEEYVNAREYRENKGVLFTKEGEKRALKDGRKADIYTRGQGIVTSGKNILKTGHAAGVSAAKSSAASGGVTSGILNMVSVIKGEKNVGEAVADTIEDTGKAAASGYMMGDGLTVISHTLSTSSSKFLRALSESNVPGKVITAVMVVGDTLKRYSEGEISTQQCLLELGEKGLNVATAGYTAAVGQALIPIPVVGAAVGALVGSVLTSGLYHNLINSLQTKELEHQERLRIIEECKEAAEQAKAFRMELEAYLDDYFREYRDCFDEALSVMDFAFQTGDADGVIAGANHITRKLGGQVHYETVDQFSDFLENGLTDIL